MTLESVPLFFPQAQRLTFTNNHFVASVQPLRVPSPSPPATTVNHAALSIPPVTSPVHHDHVRESPSELYARSLLLAKRGYALWKPQAQGVRLPDAYKREGVRIGDVGILNGFGGFTYLFNVFHSSDHPINLCRVPPNFKPLPMEDYYNVEEEPAEFEPGSHVASETSGISKSNIPFPEGQASIPGVPEDVGAGLTFLSSASEGAFLVLPEGGKRIDHQHWIALYQYTAECAQTWFDFINGDRSQGGLAMGLHEGLYLVTGCDKARAWGVASFNNARPQGIPVRLDFIPKAAEKAGGMSRYRFSRCDHATASSGADNVQSGCVFLRGFRIAIRQDPKNPFKLVTEVTFTANTDTDEFVRRLSTATYHSSNSERHLKTENNSSGECNDEASLPERYHVYHPSDVINRWILDNHDEVGIAITHDEDWVSVIQEASFPSSRLTPLLIILTEYSMKMQCQLNLN
ncbi:hypothetical protein GYMLUDRAFT_72504 [Collybiopsis luxurians FD-317 M1]|uniref:Uncharacterized protein n=1 Tax=Collybiopsis luxurians FD-317 M1 TaxID=944289 RepID=A0A0D0CJ32_9AGAR|nr:hypothetical protein GYMLUDRAFT_72504 [Collybiopsis luxurians FD-317 M1]